MTARWTDPAIRKSPLQPYGTKTEDTTLELLDRALLAGGSPNVTIRTQLLNSAPRDVEELLPHLHRRAAEHEADARKKLAGVRADEGHRRRRHLGSRSTTCDGRVRPGERLHTRTRRGEQRRAMVAARLPRHEWPDRPMILVAVDAHTGQLVAFDRDSGVDLVDAVTASTPLPGFAPTHNINGSRYVNGGVRSAENADLASGYAKVVVLSPFGGRSGTLPPGQFAGLRKQGSRVEVITPDADSLAAMGTNQMNPATRIRAARAGFAQGKREVTRVAFL